ncbi:solute carrier family 22 member 8-like isoform X2 [Ischnura elegans]|uniref:solute carrier family 22 member 8-like isoform X2 n=1 Tax=Ischnura elegans TaxID=197161 RepID=UPI001ED8B34A|nr:solute carrier family 22 member 8-like isoform X2 [Ischnura elegans]
MDFEGILDEVGGFGKYQKCLSLVFLPVMFAYTSIYCGQIFFAHSPEHWCRVPELGHLPQDVRRSISIPPTADGHWSQCSMYDRSYAGDASAQIKENSTGPWSIIPCKYGWEYDLNATFPTIVSDMNWVCNDSWRPAVGQASFFVGATLGSIILGAVADKWGRVPSLVAANTVSAAAGIGTAFIPTKVSAIMDDEIPMNLNSTLHLVNSSVGVNQQNFSITTTNDSMSPYAMFLLLRFFNGLGYDACYMMAYICILEYVDTKKRALMANLPFAVFLTMALVALPWVAYLAWDWRLFSILICIPVASIVLAPLVVPESSRWLLSKGQHSRAAKILKKVAKINGRKLREDFDDDIREKGRKLAEEAEKYSASTADLFRTPKLRKRVLLMLILWVLLTVVYDGHVRNVENLGTNLFLTFSVTGVVEAPACMLPAYTLNRFGRRPSFGIPLALSGISYLIIVAIPKSSTAWITAIAVVGRLCVVAALNSCLQFFVELLPTRLRGQGTSFVHVAGHMASLASPLIVYLADVQFYLPFLILGLLGLLGGGLAFLLPETAHQPLPETAEDIENCSIARKNSKSKYAGVIFRNSEACNEPLETIGVFQPLKVNQQSSCPT